MVVAAAAARGIWPLLLLLWGKHIWLLLMLLLLMLLLFWGNRLWLLLLLREREEIGGIVT